MMRSVIALCLMLSSLMAEASYFVPMRFISAEGQGQKIGTIQVDDTVYGLLLTPHLAHLSPGQHGFHIHTGAFCTNYAKAAGGHLDPMRTHQHAGPYHGHGHLGDLPVLFVDSDGSASLPVLAPRLKVSDVMDHAIMIHAGPDNYTDTPSMGGGGAKLACGVVPFFSTDQATNERETD
jgi:Cu-Zn family superoxide dismutase